MITAVFIFYTLNIIVGPQESSYAFKAENQVSHMRSGISIFSKTNSFEFSSQFSKVSFTPHKLLG